MKLHHPNIGLRREVFAWSLAQYVFVGLSLLRALVNPLDRFSVRGSQSLHDRSTISSSVPRSLGEGCPFGCNVSSCDATCQSAFAYCNQGGSSSQSCITEQGVLDSSVGFGWTNQVNCTGGMFRCELWIGAIGCNTSASSRSHNIGNILVDSVASSLEFALSDASLYISSVHVYLGTERIPVRNGTYFISPNNYNFKSWFSPHVSRAVLHLESPIEPGIYLIAHANVCPTTSNAPSSAPSMTSTQRNSQVIPNCPILPRKQVPILPAMSSFSTATYTPEAMSDNTRNVSRLLQWDSALCPFRCENALLSCDSRCTSALALCTEFSPTCLSNVTTKLMDQDDKILQWGWSNPVICHGGSFECELWLSVGECNTNVSGSTLVGSLLVDTDSNAVTYNVSVPNLAISSLQIILGNLRQAIEMNEHSVSIQKAWFQPNANRATIHLQSAVLPGSEFLAHANMCPVDDTTSKERSLYVNFDPNSTIESAACPIPIQTKTLPPAVSPATPTTVALKEKGTMDPTLSVQVSTDDASPLDDKGAENDDGDDDENDDGDDDENDDGDDYENDDTNASSPSPDKTTNAPISTMGEPPTCRPFRTSHPSRRPMDLIQLPPNLFRRKAFPAPFFCDNPTPVSRSGTNAPSHLPNSNAASAPPTPSNRPSPSPAESISPTTETKAPQSRFPSLNASAAPSPYPSQAPSGPTKTPASRSSIFPTTTRNPAGEASEGPASEMPTRSRTPAPSRSKPTPTEGGNDPTGAPTHEATSPPAPTPTDKPSESPILRPSPRPPQPPAKPKTDPTHDDPTAGPTADPSDVPTAEPTADPTTGSDAANPTTGSDAAAPRLQPARQRRKHRRRANLAALQPSEGT